MTAIDEMDILYTIIYVALLSYILICHQRKTNNRWGVGSYTLLSYILYPLIGALWFFNSSRAYGDVLPLRLFPFIYLAALEYIAVYPILQYDRQDIQKIEPPTMTFLHIFAVIYILCTLLQIPHIITHMADGIRAIMMDTAVGADMYHESQNQENTYDGAISNIPAIIFNVFSPLAFILFFYYLTLEKRHRWAEIGFGLCILIKSFHSLSNGQRTEVTMSVINIFVAYIALKTMLPEGLKKWVRAVLIVLAVAISIPFAALSLSRFGEREGGLFGGLIYYVGEAPYYFNNYAFDADGGRHGDRTCNIFKKLIGQSSPNGIFDTRDAYPTLEIDDSIFSSFIGDFVIDFGVWTTAFLFILFCILFTRLTPANAPDTIPFHRLILIYFAMSVCMQGGMYLFSYSFEGNLQIIAILFFYGLFLLDYLQRHKNRKEDITCN